MADFRKNLRAFFLLLLLIVLVSWLLDLLHAPKAPQGFAQQPFHTIDGRKLTIAALSAKKPLLIYFWSRDCGVCRYTTRNILSQAASGENVLIVTQRSGDDIQVVRLLQGRHLTVPVINDPTGAMAKQWQISVLPTMLVVIKGRIILYTTGWTSDWGTRLRTSWVAKWY